jgi:hypothetical protein
MGPFSFFLLVIATFTLSSAALLLGWMVTERNPNGRRRCPRREHSLSQARLRGLYPSPVSGNARTARRRVRWRSCSTQKLADDRDQTFATHRG